MLPIKFYIQKKISALNSRIRLYAEMPWRNETEISTGKLFTEIEFGFLTAEEARMFAEYLEGTAHEIRTMISEHSDV